MSTFWLEKNLMMLLLGEFDDLVFDRGAIAGPNPFNPSGVKGRFMQIGPDKVVGAGTWYG